MGEMGPYPVMDYWLGQRRWLGKMQCAVYAKSLLMFQVALVATGGLLGSQLIVGVISMMNPVRKFFSLARVA